MTGCVCIVVVVVLDLFSDDCEEGELFWDERNAINRRGCAILWLIQSARTLFSLTVASLVASHGVVRGQCHCARRFRVVSNRCETPSVVR